jgi:hypothetical protein
VPNDTDTSGIDKLQAAMGNLMGPQLEKFKSRATYYVALALKSVLIPYKPQHKPVIWASEKQRRWYFAMRSEKGLPFEYKRGSDEMSQNLQKNWGVSRQPTSATLGNRATYAPYVASRQYQTAQHAATGFTTDAQAAEKVVADGTVKRIVEAHIHAIVREAFRGLA